MAERCAPSIDDRSHAQRLSQPIASGELKLPATDVPNADSSTACIGSRIISGRTSSESRPSGNSSAFKASSNWFVGSAGLWFPRVPPMLVVGRCRGGSQPTIQRDYPMTAP